MIKPEEDEITNLYNESVDEASASARPQYLVFAEKIMNRELEMIAKVLCFQCAEGIKAEKKGRTTVWIHTITGTSGYEFTEICRADAVRRARE